MTQQTQTLGKPMFPTHIHTELKTDEPFRDVAVRGESGRSMIEIFGVLAIIGVLSIIGLIGYRYAIDYHRANEIIGTVGVERATVLTQNEANSTFTPSEGRIMSLYNYTRDVLPENVGFVVTVEDVSSGVCASVLNRRWDEPKYLIDGVLVDNFNTDLCYDNENKPIQVAMSFVFGWTGVSFEDDDDGTGCDLTAPCLNDAGLPDERIRVEEHGACICKCPAPNDMHDTETGKCECPKDTPRTFYDAANKACICPPATTPHGADTNTCACLDDPNVHLTSDNWCVTCSEPKTGWDAANGVCICDPTVTCAAGKIKDSDCNCTICDDSVSCPTGKVKNANCDCVCDGSVSCPAGKVKDADCNCVCDESIACPAGKIKDADCDCTVCDPDVSCTPPKIKNASCACVCDESEPCPPSRVRSWSDCLCYCNPDPPCISLKILDTTTCQCICNPGITCPAGQVKDINCNCVPPCPTNCGAGKYLVGCSCYICPKGHKCDGVTKTPCAPGSQIPFEEATFCAPCSDGTYQDLSGAWWCKSCPQRARCEGQGNPTFTCWLGKGLVKTANACICPDGKYWLTIVTGCLNCPVGCYCTGGTHYACPFGTCSPGGPSCVSVASCTPC